MKIKWMPIVIGVPILAALLYYLIFSIDVWSSLWGLMTLTFFLSIPYALGALTIYLSSLESIRTIRARITLPWLPIAGFFILTVAFSLEGIACWLMALPLFLSFSSLGGLTAGYFRLRKSKRSNDLHLVTVLLLPIFIGPVEQMIGSIPGFYDAYTYVDISAPGEVIWSNVTRVKNIEKVEDRSVLTKFLLIPRPIKAELDYEGVGASRKAIFEGGLVFDETVLAYDHMDSMRFSIKANTFDIPSTTFDEHVLIGGNYFDVLEGTYRLEQTGQNQYRLHLESQFKLNTTFNFYASIWGRLIMKDIQQNILGVIKSRSETSV